MTTAPLTEEDKPSWAELQRRLAFALMRPVMRICRLFRLPLSTVEELCRMAYFEEIRFGGHHSQAEAALLMNRSLRTIGNLERQYRSDFLAPADELTLVREVEEAFSDAPLTAAEAAEALPHIDPHDVERMVASLVALTRLVPATNGDAGRFALDRSFVSLFRQDPEVQVDGLHHQMDVIVEAVLARFFTKESTAMARTLSFVALPEEMEALNDELIRHLRARCIDAEENALKSRAHRKFAVTIAAAPMDRNDNS